MKARACQRCSHPTRAKAFRGYVFCVPCRAFIRWEFDGYRRRSLQTYLGIKETRRLAPQAQRLAA